MAGFFTVVRATRQLFPTGRRTAEFVGSGTGPRDPFLATEALAFGEGDSTRRARPAMALQRARVLAVRAPHEPAGLSTSVRFQVGVYRRLVPLPTVATILRQGFCVLVLAMRTTEVEYLVP